MILNFERHKTYNEHKRSCNTERSGCTNRGNTQPVGKDRTNCNQQIPSQMFPRNFQRKNPYATIKTTSSIIKFHLHLLHAVYTILWSTEKNLYF